MATFKVLATVDMVVEGEDSYDAEEKALEAIALANEYHPSVVQLITITDTVHPYAMRQSVPQEMRDAIP